MTKSSIIFYWLLVSTVMSTCLTDIFLPTSGQYCSDCLWKLQKNYASSWIVEVTEHDDWFDIFFIDHFPEFRETLRSGSLSKDREVFSVYYWLHMTCIAVVNIRAIAFNSTMVVCGKINFYRLKCRCICSYWSFWDRESPIHCKTLLSSRSNLSIILPCIPFRFVSPESS